MNVGIHFPWRPNRSRPTGNNPLRRSGNPMRGPGIPRVRGGKSGQWARTIRRRMFGLRSSKGGTR